MWTDGVHSFKLPCCSHCTEGHTSESALSSWTRGNSAAVNVLFVSPWEHECISLCRIAGCTDPQLCWGPRSAPAPCTRLHCVSSRSLVYSDLPIFTLIGVKSLQTPWLSVPLSISFICSRLFEFLLSDCLFKFFAYLPLCCYFFPS